jgi:threonyl-tRNA synthetase
MGMLRMVVARDETMKQRDIGSFPIAEVIARYKHEVDEKRIRQVSTASAGLADSKAKCGG